MKVSAFIRKTAKKNDTDSKATIYFRLRGKGKDLKAASELSINPNHWSSEKQGYKDRVALVREEEKLHLNGEIQNIISIIASNYREDCDSKWLNETIDRYHHPNRYKTEEQIAQENKPSFHELFEEFLLKHKMSEGRKKGFKVISRVLKRYELFIRGAKQGQESFALDIDRVTADTLHDMWDFFENEPHYFEEYSPLYEQIPEKRAPKPRGRNTIGEYFRLIRTFFLWCYGKKKTRNRPFDEFRIEQGAYTTPFYLSLEERNKILELDLSENPKLEKQRDIFIFQSLIGCRAGDLYRMTKNNIINGTVEYIPRKTKEGNPITVRVPLNEKARLILNKYKDMEGEKILPFACHRQEYNEAIKKILTLAGVTRMVTVINPLTREEEKRALNEIASSHLARRTFIGNIYKKVKDPNLVGALSGHKEGSTAFYRYREIDEDMKKELVSILD